MRIIKKRGILSLALALALVFSFVPSFNAKATTYSRDDTEPIVIMDDGTIDADSGYDVFFNVNVVCGFYQSVSFDSVSVDSAAKTIKFTNLTSSGELSYVNQDNWTIIFDGTCNTNITVEQGYITIALTSGSTLKCGTFTSMPGSDRVTLGDGVTVSPADADLGRQGASNVTFSREAEATTDETTVTYTIVEGANQNVAAEAGKDLVIKASGDLAKFTDLKIDGTVVDKANYETAQGSTIATIKSSFVDTLAAGSHTVTFVYTDGEVSTAFTLTKAAEVTTPSNDEATTEATTTTAQSPKTGDGMMVFIILLTASAIGMSIITKVSLKKK